MRGHKSIEPREASVICVNKDAAFRGEICQSKDIGPLRGLGYLLKRTENPVGAMRAQKFVSSFVVENNMLEITVHISPRLHQRSNIVRAQSRNANIARSVEGSWRVYARQGY